jgi:hypothetical protein
MTERTQSVQVGPACQSDMRLTAFITLLIG